MSLSDPTSLFYSTRAANLLDGTLTTAYKPYLTLSGTSMAAPVVSGTVALMLQANPSLTPNLVKAILQYTAQTYDYDALTQGAGFLNTQGAVQLAKFFRRPHAGDPYPTSDTWSKQIIWGNQLLSGGALDPRGSAWESNVVVGQPDDPQRSEHRVGHCLRLVDLRRRRLGLEHRVGHQHRLGHQHRVGHEHRVGDGAERRSHRVGLEHRVGYEPGC